MRFWRDDQFKSVINVDGGLVQATGSQGYFSQHVMSKHGQTLTTTRVVPDKACQVRFDGGVNTKFGSVGPRRKQNRLVLVLAKRMLLSKCVQLSCRFCQLRSLSCAASPSTGLTRAGGLSATGRGPAQPPRGTAANNQRATAAVPCLTQNRIMRASS